ncbi:MAG: hypothetical protein ACE5E0_00015 [Terriglobia bacterium]
MSAGRSGSPWRHWQVERADHGVLESIVSFARAAEIRRGHAPDEFERLVEVSGAIAKCLGLSPSDVARIEMAARLRDIGLIPLEDGTDADRAVEPDERLGEFEIHPKLSVDLLGSAAFTKDLCRSYCTTMSDGMAMGIPTDSRARQSRSAREFLPWPNSISC